MLIVVDHAHIITRAGEPIESFPTVEDCENVARRWSINHPEVFSVYSSMVNHKDPGDMGVSRWVLVSTWANGHRHFKAKAKGTT